jgi:antitoxin ParD1/3/4
MVFSSNLEKHMRRTKPITVTLGPQQAGVDVRLKSGTYSSASEVLRAALRALDREEAALDEILRRRVEASLTDRRASIPAEQVFARLRAHQAKRAKAKKRGA